MDINKALTVTRSNMLVHSSYQLTLNERRLIECGIAKIKRGSTVPETIEVTAEEFASAFNIDMRNAYAELEDATDNLYEQSIEIINPEKDARARFRWVEGVKYFDGEGRVELDFTKWVRPYLQDLSDNYTSYRLLDIQRLNSTHAMRLYELLMQFQKTGIRRDSLHQLRRLMGVEDKYPKWIAFDRRVIRPSVENINKSSNWKVTYKTKKKGRKIDRIEFQFHLKDQPLLDL